MTITGGEIVTGIEVDPIDEATAWSADRQGRPVLAVAVTRPGDFSTYRLAISSSRLDPFLSQAPFTFTAGSPAGTDCAAPAPGGPGSRAERRAGTHRLPGQGLRQLPAGAVGVLRPALPGLGGAVGGRPRRHADGGPRGDGRRAQLLPGPRPGGSPPSRPRPSDCRPSGTPGWWITSRPRPPPRPPSSSSRCASGQRTPSTAGHRPDVPVLISALGADGTTVDFEIEDPAVGPGRRRRLCPRPPGQPSTLAGTGLASAALLLG